MKTIIYGALILTILLGSCIPVFAASSKKPEDSWRATPFSKVLSQSNSTTPHGYTPSQIHQAYSIPNGSDGAHQTIAIIGAYDDSTLQNDISTFNATFHLPSLNGLTGTPACTVRSGPHPCFQKMYAQSKPATSSGWATETSLDTEWSHATAPASDILLIEASSPTLPNLLSAVDKGVTEGATIVSMSWGDDEFSTENNYESHFQIPGVTFIAASGDSGHGVEYPASSPHVLSVGGTHLELNGSTRLSETAWTGSGGGASSYFPQPNYQFSFATAFTTHNRLVPDVSLNADPITGYPIYSQGKWITVGGTSAGAPEWAGISALINQNRKNNLIITNSSPFYTAAQGSAYARNYSDISSGKNGSCGSLCSTHPNYDPVTGLGVPIVSQLMQALRT